MKFKYIKIKGYKNLDFEMTFPDDGVAAFIGNNGSGKSNVLEAVSLIFGYYYKNILHKKYVKQIENYLSFDYEVKYKKNDKEVILNNSIDEIEKNLLPKKIYAIYSGEDLKLWQNFFFPFYDSYIRKIKSMKVDELPLVYINKYFWDIAILMHYLFNNALEDLKLGSLKEIYFSFSNNLFKSDLKDNKIVSFIKKISKNEKEKNFKLDEFKDLYDYELRNIKLSTEKEQQQEFFELLLSAYLPDKGLKTFKFINKLELKFDNDNRFDFLDLSEGEKKLILLKLLFNILLDENSILLLDEPDDNIHPANKTKLNELINNCELKEKNIIITTHSPTLTHLFEEKNIFMLDDGKIINKDKREIIEFLTNQQWTYQDINIILSSNKDIFLVEGKTDEEYLKTALKIFQNRGMFKNLDFFFLPVGGASGLKFFLEKFKEENNRLIFALLDSDIAGDKSFRKFLGEEKEKELKKDKVLKMENNILLYVPTSNELDIENKNYEIEIEDLFPNKVKKFLFRCKIRNDLKNIKNIKSFPKGGKQLIKDLIENEVKKFNTGEETILKEEDFGEFKKIFEIIEQIKNESK